MKKKSVKSTNQLVKSRLTKLSQLLKKKLLTNDLCVLVVHQNHSIELFHNAYCRYEDISDRAYLFIFTKDQGNFVYPATKLIYFTRFKWEPIEMADILLEDPDLIKE